jgi:hypothetical protein
MIAKWKASPNPPNNKEICKRLIDIFLVSVLLDAGAGNDWDYHEKVSGLTFSRSEGLGVASINMFEAGFFSGDSEQPYKVDGKYRYIAAGSTSTLRNFCSRGIIADNPSGHSSSYAG